jgi:ABC-type Fe3+-siderophore transport system permease subunit
MAMSRNVPAARRLRPALTRLFVALGLGLVVVVALSIFIGRYPAPYWMPPDLLGRDEMAQRLVLSLRLPRITVRCYWACRCRRRATPCR